MYVKTRLSSLVLVLGVVVSIVTCQQCSSDIEYVELDKPKPRITMLQKGNYTIQVLLHLSDSKTCKTVSRAGLLQMYSVQYAVDKFNSNLKYSRYATIGLQVDDSCGNLPTTMARGIEIVSFHRPNSVCRADFLQCNQAESSSVRKLAKKASAVIGTGLSFTAIPLSSLMSLYRIPQISPSASSRLLSKRDLYKSFFRTIPSDVNQISAMLAIFKEFKWNYIFAIGSDDDYGKLGIAELKQRAAALPADEDEVCIFKDEYIPFQSSNTADKVKEVVKKIKEGDKATVVVLFTYVEEIGERILKAAAEEGIQRIWLTSEAWNPAAAEVFNKPEYRTSLQNVSHGILSVSLKRYRLDHLFSYIERRIIADYKCNDWLKTYVSKHFNCTLGSYDATSKEFTCANSPSAPLLLNTLLDNLKILPDFLSNLIDATTSLCHAMHDVIRQKCGDNSTGCSIDDLSTSAVTSAMDNVRFVNEHNKTIYFQEGNPAVVLYSIENLVRNAQGDLQYVPVGEWNGNLTLQKDKIQWPIWFNSTLTLERRKSWPYPKSICSEICQPGTKLVVKSGCCWACHKCSGNDFQDKPNQTECKPCGPYKHTLDHISCTQTPIKWLKIDESTGMSIVIVSLIGLIVTLCTTVFIFKYRNLVSIHDTSRHMLTFVCFLLFLTFIYGPLHVLKPTTILCQVRNSYFFVLLMMYCSFVLVKTQAMTNYLRGHAERTFKGNLLAPQLIVLFLFFLLEVVSVIVWLSVDKDSVQEFHEKYSILMQCQVDFTATRLVSTFIPCIILIIATFCAFRERNADHSFYEPKFLSFSCIALCIIIVAFLPTFRYVVGIYKAIVLAFTMNVFGYTFMACLVLPKVYVGVMRKRKGINEYPIKAGTVKRKSKKNKRKKLETDFESSAIESTFKTKNVEQTQSTSDGVSMRNMKTNDGDFDDEQSADSYHGMYDTKTANASGEKENGIHTGIGFSDSNGVSIENTNI